MHHLLVYTASIAQNVDVDVSALADSIFVIQNGHFLPQRDFNLIFAGAASANMNRARIISSSLRQYTTPYIRPVSSAAGWGFPQRVYDLFATPLLLRALEEIQVNAVQTGAAAEQVWIGLGLETQRTPRPPGQIFTMRGTSTTAAAANTWTQIAVTWQDVLPAGLYALCGLEVSSANARFARAILEGQVWRPGSFSIQAVGNGNHERFKLGGLGEWGRFNSWAMPNIEVVCSAADASHDVYLDLVRVG